MAISITYFMDIIGRRTGSTAFLRKLILWLCSLLSNQAVMVTEDSLPHVFAVYFHSTFYLPTIMHLTGSS